MGPSLQASIVPSNVASLLALVFVLPIAYQLSFVVYNLFFHPLRHFPGPKLGAASPWPKIYLSLKGESISWIVGLHLKYGEVVRVAPNELSFSGADAWKDIYGHKKAGQPSLTKDPAFYRSPGTEVESIVTADSESHARQRRIFANAFSDRALKMQEPLFLTYVNKLVSSMRRKIQLDPDQSFNMVNMYNFTTFDIMGDLTFGEPLNMLEDAGYHPWVAAILAGFRYGTYLHCIRYFPMIESLLLKLIPQSIREKQRLHHEFSRARVDRRLEKQDARPDIWGLVLEREEEESLSKREMYVNSETFMIAGTETTATLLSGLTFYLLTNADKLSKLKEEIRSAFSTDDEITIERLQALTYLQACVEEGLRMYTPVANGLPRVVPTGGAMLDGRMVPTGAQVYVTNLAAYRNSDSFREPFSFIPERWLPEYREFATDKKHALQPFSTGPRVCLGKNMAYHEIRLILSKTLWHFDLELCTGSENWNEQKIFIMWEKKPLYCRLRPIQRSS